MIEEYCRCPGCGECSAHEQARLKSSVKKKPMSLKDILRVQEECRESLKKLAKLYPGCFDENGNPIVASIRLP